MTPTPKQVLTASAWPPPGQRTACSEPPTESCALSGDRSLPVISRSMTVRGGAGTKLAVRHRECNGKANRAAVFSQNRFQ